MGCRRLRAMNPWATIWFSPRKTLGAIRESRPLYGVIAILVVLIIVDSLRIYLGSASDEDAPSLPASVFFAVRALLFPAITLGVLWVINRRYRTHAGALNLLSVMTWSQLPLILLAVVAIGLILGKVDFYPPVLTNDILFECGVLKMTPPVPDIKPVALLYSLVSTVFFLWSFQILLVGLSEVMKVRMSRALWIVSMTMIAVLVLDVIMSTVFGNFSIFSFLGFSEFTEAPEISERVDCS